MDPDPEPSSFFASFLSPLTDPPLVELGWSTVSLSILLPLWLLITYTSSYVRSLQSLNGSASEELKERKDAKSNRLLTLIEEKNEFLLVLRTFISILSVTFTVLLFHALYTYPPLLNSSRQVIFGATIVLLSVLLIIARRITPKIVATRFALPFALRGVTFAFVLHQVSKPLTRPITKWFHSSIGYGKPEVHFLSGEDLKAMADIGEAQGTIEEEERELIHSIVDFRESEVRDVMVNRMDMHAISTKMTFQDAIQLVQSTGHSRLPLYEEHLDNVIGIVYAKDLLAYIPSNYQIDMVPDWRKIAREPFYVPASRPLDDMLKDFKTRKKHLAIVLDDYGGTDGLVTMEDVLEELVGDIRDEFDDAEEDLHEQIGESIHLCDARIHLDDFSDLLNLELNTEEFDFDTLGGLIFHLKGEIPQVGDEVFFDSLKMRIESIENHRIGRVLIQVLPPTEDTTPVL